MVRADSGANARSSIATDCFTAVSTLVYGAWKETATRSRILASSQELAKQLRATNAGTADQMVLKWLAHGRQQSVITVWGAWKDFAFHEAKETWLAAKSLSPPF